MDTPAFASSSGPLAGLRVIDAGNMIAGPLGATQMADFGADVIKLELPGTGDSIRHWAPLKNGLSLWWKVIGRNKRLVTLTLSKPRGRELFLQMVRDADVVIENFRPGTFESWGLDYSTLAAQNPKLIMVRVSGFGQTGPYSSRGGYGTVAEAFSGIPSFTGTADRPPTLPGFPMADSIAATFAAMSAMFAIYNRDHGTGCGQEIDVSLYEPLFRLVESQVIGFDQLGIVKKRIGNRLAEDSPRNTYLTSDRRWIGVSASSQRTFELLARAVGKPELIVDPRFISNAKRCEYDEALDATLAGWFAERRCGEIMTLFEQAGVVAGPVYDIQDIFQDPHYLARQNIVSVPDDDFGTVRMQGVTPRFLRTPGRVRHAGLPIGADNREVYMKMLGLSEQEFRSLQAEGII